MGYVITCLSIAKVANLTISLDRSAGEETAVVVSVGNSKRKKGRKQICGYNQPARWRRTVVVAAETVSV